LIFDKKHLRDRIAELTNAPDLEAWKLLDQNFHGNPSLVAVASGVLRSGKGFSICEINSTKGAPAIQSSDSEALRKQTPFTSSVLKVLDEHGVPVDYRRDSCRDWNVATLNKLLTILKQVEVEQPVKLETKVAPILAPTPPRKILRQEGPIQISAVLNRHELAEKKQNIVFMGVEVKCRGQVPQRQQSVCPVIDVSGSMEKESKMELAKRAALNLAKSLNPTDRIALVSFGTKAKVELSPTEVGDGSTLESALEAMQQGGSTALFDGLDSGAKLFKEDSSPLKRVVLLSDGNPTVGPRGVGSYKDLAEEMRKSGVRVLAVGVGEKYNERLMVAMAEANQGYWYHMRDFDSAADVFLELSNSFRQVFDPELSLDIKLSPGVEILDAFRVSPLLYHAVIEEQGDVYTCYLGDIDVDSVHTLVFRLKLKSNRAGEENIASVSLHGSDAAYSEVSAKFSPDSKEQVEKNPRTRILFNLVELIVAARGARLANKENKVREEERKVDILLKEIEQGNFLKDPLVKILVETLKNLFGEFASEHERREALQQTTIIKARGSGN
jgi:von Willebrand factor type A domain